MDNQVINRISNGIIIQEVLSYIKTHRYSYHNFIFEEYFDKYLELSIKMITKNSCKISIQKLPYKNSNQNINYKPILQMIDTKNDNSKCLKVLPLITKC